MNNSRLTDCNSPNFIKRYFETSRLHHLSIWKAELSEFVAKLMRDKSRSKPTKVYRASSEHEPFRTIMHIDMDCFFASIGARSRPHLDGKPVAVAHSQGGLSLEYSTSEIASCNYVAREKGVKNGCFIGSAKQLCPDLIIIPYEFEAYDACSKELYDTLLDVADYVQAVSCDEAFVDITFLIQYELKSLVHAESIEELERRSEYDGSVFEAYDRIALQFANSIRKRIFGLTKCCASVGIGKNILMARLATHKAKPNGAFSLLPELKAVVHIKGTSLSGLPGVGSSAVEKCAQLQLLTCEDMQRICSDREDGVLVKSLRAELGEKVFENLRNNCWGVDHRILENKTRQSVGSDINWGIRFTCPEQVERFLREFCAEVFGRLEALQMSAKHVTVSVKKKNYEGEPGKYLGCGRCVDLSRSLVPSRAIASANALFLCVSQLFKEIGVSPLDTRGVGIHLKKLVPLKCDFFAPNKTNSSSIISHEENVTNTCIDTFSPGIPPVVVNTLSPHEEINSSSNNNNNSSINNNNNSSNNNNNNNNNNNSFICSFDNAGQGVCVFPSTAEPPVEPFHATTDSCHSPLSFFNGAAGGPGEFSCRSDLSDINMGDVDLDVFCELPEDIQNELRQALSAGSQVKAKTGETSLIKRKPTELRKPKKKNKITNTTISTKQVDIRKFLANAC